MNARTGQAGAAPAVPPASGEAVLPGQAQGQGRTRSRGSEGTTGRARLHADAGRSAEALADAAAVGNLLCCWVRENDIQRPTDDGDLLLPLNATGVTLHIPVRYWSATGRHDFGPPVLAGVSGRAPVDPTPLDAVTLAALLAREAAHAARASGRAGAEGSADLVSRVADSVHRTGRFVRARDLETRSVKPRHALGGGPFLDAEQALVLGHPLHPAPKSRQGLSDEECDAYAPEVRAALPLHWFAVDASVLACDSAWTERGRLVRAEQLAVRLAGEEVTSRLPGGTVPLPLHPWQARAVRHRPAVARLFADGLLHDLGTAVAPGASGPSAGSGAAAVDSAADSAGSAGAAGSGAFAAAGAFGPAGGGHGDDALWYPTSSVRTVCRPGGPAMLKLSLGVPITNSRRENLRKESLRGLEVHRLLRSGLGAQWRAVHPGFDIVRDPAWLGVDGPDGEPVPGLDTVVRHNPFRPDDDAACVAGLTALRPWPGLPQGTLRSRLADLLEGIAARTGHSVTTVATEWFLRYLDAVVSPLLWLDAHAGIALEAHQQNTLVLLDEEGWPCGGRYRDNQGYYFRESRRDALQQRLPHARLGVASDSFVGDAVADERFAYYAGINNVLGLVGALGVQRLADEGVLLAAARRFLRAASKGSGDGPVSALPALLLESPTLRCKANLLTRVHGMDELVGPVDTQSVYVTVTNPLHR